jgi:hypothetical protein
MSEIIRQGSSIKKLAPINSDCGMGIAKYSRIGHRAGSIA